MKKNELIKIAQIFCEEYAQVYPTQDYQLQPKGDQYGTPSVIPFPNENGVSCVFDDNDECIYIFIHTSWSNYFNNEKIKTLESNWEKIPCYIISFVLRGDQNINLSMLAQNLKIELIKKAHPYENQRE